MEHDVILCLRGHLTENQR